VKYAEQLADVSATSDAPLAQPIPAPDGTATGALDDAPTRERVVSSILENGPSTAAALAERLVLTPAAVRRHLDNLVEDGAIEAREPRVTATRGRGRPAKVFVITDLGRETFTQAYDDMAVSALRFLRETGGPDAVTEFARRRTSELEDRYRPVVQAADPGDQNEALASALSADGYAASVQGSPIGDQLCQHHCPVAHVAAEFPQLCEAETEVFARLLGRHVQRLATIAHGDGVCTTNIPRPGVGNARGPAAKRHPASTPTGRTTA